MQSELRDKGAIVGYMILWGTLWGIAAGAATGGILGLIALLIGVAIGLLFGGFIGLFTGLLMGIVVGIVTAAFFYPLEDDWLYRMVLGLICSGGSALVVYIGISALIPSSTFFAIIVTVYAFILGGLVSQKLAAWYIER